jgi:hypothetical protein
VEVVLLGIFFLDAQAAAMLPHIALLTCNAVTSIIQVLAMYATTRAVEDPLVLFGKLCQVLLRFLHLGLQVARRDPALASLQLLLISRKALNLGFVQNALVLTILDALLAGHHTGNALILHLLLASLLLASFSQISLPFASGLGGFAISPLLFFLGSQSTRSLSTSKHLHLDKLLLPLDPLALLRFFGLL